MFEKEYITQKILLFFSMILILSFAGKYLSTKNGISSYEASTYAISSTKDALADSPYNNSVYNTDELKKNITEQPYFFSIYHIGHYITEMATDYQNASILEKAPSSYTNTDWIDNSYYTSLLSVTDEDKFQYSAVIDNCTTAQKAPLYYCILHTVSSIFGSLSLFRLGFSINVCFLFLSSFLILSIGKKYLHSSWAGLAAALLFSLSLGCFSGTICTTPYIMTIFFLLAITSLHLSGITKKELPNYLLESITMIHVIGTLTNYSYFLFSAALFVCFSIMLLCFKRTRDFLKYTFANLVALLATILIYPASMLHGATAFFRLKQDISSFFSLDSLKRACARNLSVINGQLFVKTGLLLGLTLLILVLLAIILKRDTFKNLFLNFKLRISQQDVGDIFLLMLIVVYFIGISLFYRSELYFELMTLLPFIALVVCYVCYRLCNAAIHSEFNSGLIGIIGTCLICFLSIATSTPKYVYADEATQLKFADTYKKEYCIFLSSDTLDPADHILELQKYEHSIVLDSSNLSSLVNNQTFLSQDKVLVYLSNADYVMDRMDTIARFGDFNISHELTNYKDKHANSVYVYQLTKMK